MNAIDFAQQYEQDDRALALRAELSKPDRTPPTGHCYFCTADVPGESRFCDHDCQRDFDRLQWSEAQRARE